MDSSMLFSPFTMLKFSRMFDVYNLFPPDDSYALMRRLLEAERKHLLAPMMDEMSHAVRSKLKLVPQLVQQHNLDDLTDQFVQWVVDVNFESAFLAAALKRADPIEAGLVDLGNIAVLESAIGTGRPIVLAPLHLGPCYVCLPILASRFPLTTLYHKMPLNELKKEFFDHIDIRGIEVPAPQTLYRCVSVLKEGRILSMFPELDPAGPGRLHVRVPFFDVEVKAPSGPALLSQRYHALIVPCVFRRTAPARYRFTFFDPIDAAAGNEGRIRAIAKIFRSLEQELTISEPGAWEMWWEFDQIIALQWRTRMHQG
ncbi:MAG TPA: hypothetical protein VF221_07815 [Chloroflexota bacterium]